jgi:hypothetical protein
MRCTTVLFCNCLPRLLSLSTGTPKLFILCHIINNQKPSRDTTSKWFVHRQEYSGMHLQNARKGSIIALFYIIIKLLCCGASPQGISGGPDQMTVRGVPLL